jgi:hypothetical protein
MIKILLVIFILPIGIVLLFPIMALGYVWGIASTAFTDAAQNGREHWYTQS